MRRRRKIEVNFPPVSTTGRPSPCAARATPDATAGPTGDLYATVSIRPHAIFTRNGPDVLCEIPITFTEAALGAELEVATIDGKVKYTIPEGTQPGSVFRLRGKGIPILNSKGTRRPLCHGQCGGAAQSVEAAEGALREFAGELKPENHTPENRSFLPS